MFGWFRKSTRDEAFVDSPMRDNWYQSSSYFLSSFALITSVAEDGSTSIARRHQARPAQRAQTRRGGSTFVAPQKPRLVVSCAHHLADA